MFYAIIFYSIYLILFGLFSLAAIYHLLRFGYAGDKTRLLAIIYVVVASSIILITILTLILRA